MVMNLLRSERVIEIPTMASFGGILGYDNDSTYNIDHRVELMNSVSLCSDI